jgi:hypothetical protein
VLLVSGGRTDGLVIAARLAVTDWRDLRLAADARRERTHNRMFGASSNRRSSTLYRRVIGVIWSLSKNAPSEQAVFFGYM